MNTLRRDKFRYENDEQDTHFPYTKRQLLHDMFSKLTILSSHIVQPNIFWVDIIILNIPTLEYTYVLHSSMNHKIHHSIT